MGYEDPATETQLTYLLKFGYTPSGPLTRGETSDLIEQFSEDPERCRIRDEKQIEEMVKQEEAAAWNLHNEVNEAKEDPDGELEYYLAERVDFWAGTFSLVKADDGQGLDLYTSHGRFFSAPSLKQIQDILDALDAALPTWDKDHPELLYQTLELNHPELKSSGT